LRRKEMSVSKLNIDDLPVKTNFRFDRELHQKLAEAARRSVRSINGEMLFRLRASFEQQDEQTA
jgi:predicted HicB family RNase H-like nuclease